MFDSEVPLKMQYGCPFTSGLKVILTKSLKPKNFQTRNECVFQIRFCISIAASYPFGSFPYAQRYAVNLAPDQLQSLSGLT